MLTRSKISDGLTYLGHHLVSNDYYCEGESVSGRWVGKGAERLGLTNGRSQSADALFKLPQKNRLVEAATRTPNQNVHLR